MQHKELSRRMGRKAKAVKEKRALNPTKSSSAMPVRTQDGHVAEGKGTHGREV